MAMLIKKLLPALFFFLFVTMASIAQVTTSTISGIVLDQTGQPLDHATVTAIHVPSGTKLHYHLTKGWFFYYQ